jgi:hypothetical protein
VRTLTDAELEQVRMLKTTAEQLQAMIDAIRQGEMSPKDERLIELTLRVLEEVDVFLESTKDVMR